MRGEKSTRERIEEAARRLFVERGIDATSIREVARRAGVSLGAMYNHYTGKEELAYALFADGWAEIGADLRRIARDGDGLEARLRAMIRYVMDRFEQDWVWVTYVFFARHANLRRVMSRRLPNPYLAFKKVVSDAIEAEEVPKQDPALATAMVTGVIIQVIDSRILGQIDGRLDTQADDVARACVKLLRS